MRLDSGAFLAVFSAFFLLYSVVPSKEKRVLLVVGSIAFYATTSLAFVPLLLALGLFTFFVGLWIHREAGGARRDRLLWVGVGVNVLALGFFKGAAPAAGIFSMLGVGWGARLLNLSTPLGASFYTLQAVSYLVDVHRRVYEPPRSLISFLASFTLFPHLLSGPIVRSSFLVPLIERAEGVSWPTARRAMLIFTVGLLKKAVADKLAPVANSAFDAARAISMFEAWTGLIAYAGQLYGDFSGYTDMATALALLLGLDLPPNFHLPYLASSPADFWRRWHISLSSWLRDYVYLPLGVRFRRRRHANIVMTWVIAGLWHGITSLFLLYGLYHGVLLAVTDWLSRRSGTGEPAPAWRRVVQTTFTFYLVLMGYVLFRARSVATAAHYLASLHAPRTPSNLTRETIVTALACAAALVFSHLLDHGMQTWRAAIERRWIMWPAMAFAVTCIALFSGAAQPFIYFAF